jgi:hypothetical protein
MLLTFLSTKNTQQLILTPENDVETLYINCFPKDRAVEAFVSQCYRAIKGFNSSHCRSSWIFDNGQ